MQTKTPSTKPQSKVGVSAEIKLNPNNPIPLEQSGVVFSVVPSHFYLPYLDGSDNFFPTLLGARVLSTTHNACVSTKTNYCVGNGVVVNLKENQAEDEQFKALRQRANANRQTLNDVIRKGFDTFFTFGNAPFEIVRGSFGKTKYVYIYCHNQLDCRLSRPNAQNQVDTMFISRQFRKKGLYHGQNSVRSIPLYQAGVLGRAKSWKQDKSVERTAIWLRNEMAGYDHYGLPSAISSLPHQLVEYQTVRYNLDNLENNMVPGGVIFLAGNVTEEEGAKVGRRIIHQHTGPGKRGRVIVLSSEGGDMQDSKFQAFNTQKEGSYTKLDGTAESKIVQANEWDPVLAGLDDSSGLGKGAGYREEVYSQKLETVIRPAQVFFMDNLIRPFLQICDEWMGTKWSAMDVDIQPMPASKKRNGLITTPEGIKVFMEIVKAVHDGYYTLAAAIKMVSRRFDMTEAEAAEELGDIKPNNQPAS